MKTVKLGNKEFYVLPVHPEIIRQLELTAKEKWKIQNRSERTKKTSQNQQLQNKKSDFKNESR